MRDTKLRRRGVNSAWWGQRILWVASCTLSLFCWASSSQALQVTGLNGPQSFLSDSAHQEYFISNVNGESDARDNNGFITKLDGKGKVVNLHFIQGGKGRTILHAPKGMAIVRKVLYVADLDTLRGFDTETGAPLVTVTIPSPPGISQGVGLADVLHAGKGFLYMSDFVTNTIYRINTNDDHAISVLVRDETLSGPRGLTLDPRTGHLIVASWDKGKILDVDGRGHITELVSNGFFSSRFKNLDGLDFDTWGNLYISDFTTGKIWRMRPDGHFQVIAEYLPTPADISVDRENNLILVPYLYSNTAEMNGLESPNRSRKKNRTLADYGFGFPAPPERERPPE